MCGWISAAGGYGAAEEILATATGCGDECGDIAGTAAGGIVFDRAGYGAVVGIAYGLWGGCYAAVVAAEKKVAARWMPEVGGRERAWNGSGDGTETRRLGSTEGVRDSSNALGRESPEGHRPQTLSRALPS